MRIGALIAAAVSVGVCAATGAAADEVYPTVSVVDTRTTVVGEALAYPATGPAHVSAVTITLAPGGETVLHHHPAPMFAYILEGEVTVDYGAAGKRTYRQGDGFMEAMTLPHRGRNTGTAPVRILAVFMGADGTANSISDAAGPPGKD